MRGLSVDNFRQLFLGYAVAARELERQLSAAGRSADADNPLFVYLPEVATKADIHAD